MTERQVPTYQDMAAQDVLEITPAPIKKPKMAPAIGIYVSKLAQPNGTVTLSPPNPTPPATATGYSNGHIMGPSKNDIVFYAQQTMRVVDILTNTSSLAAAAEMSHELIAMSVHPNSSIFRKAAIQLLLAEVSPGGVDPMQGEKDSFAPESHATKALYYIKELKTKGVAKEDEAAVKLVEDRAVEVSGFWKRGAWETFLRDEEKHEAALARRVAIGPRAEVTKKGTLWKKLFLKFSSKSHHKDIRNTL